MFGGIELCSKRDIIKGINSVYNEVISDYNDINRNLGLSHPIEVGSLFNSVLYDGYLSRNKVFTFGSAHVIDLIDVSGANIMNGEGVCRHISVLLKDIYNNYDMDACAFNIHLRSRELLFGVDKSSQGYSKDKLYHFIDMLIFDEEENKRVKLEVDKHLEEVGEHLFLLAEFDEKIKSFFVRPNHRINLVVYNGEVFLYDPTHNKTYKVNEKNPKLLIDLVDEWIPITFTFFEVINEMRLKDVKRYLSMPSLSFEDNYQKIMQTRQLYKDNRDIFEKFYDEHKDAYYDIADKMMQLGAKKKTKERK